MVPHPVKAIIDSLERRWSKSDQYLFICAAFLNPLVATRLFNPKTISLIHLLDICSTLYKRVFRVSSLPDGFAREFRDYGLRMGNFASEHWSIGSLGS